MLDQKSAAEKKVILCYILDKLQLLARYCSLLPWYTKIFNAWVNSALGLMIFMVIGYLVPTGPLTIFFLLKLLSFAGHFK